MPSREEVPMSVKMERALANLKTKTTEERIQLMIKAELMTEAEAEKAREYVKSVEEAKVTKKAAKAQRSKSS